MNLKKNVKAYERKVLLLIKKSIFYKDKQTQVNPALV